MRDAARGTHRFPRDYDPAPGTLWRACQTRKAWANVGTDGPASFYLAQLLAILDEPRGGRVFGVSSGA